VIKTIEGYRVARVLDDSGWVPVFGFVEERAYALPGDAMQTATNMEDAFVGDIYAPQVRRGDTETRRRGDAETIRKEAA